MRSVHLRFSDNTYGRVAPVAPKAFDDLAGALGILGEVDEEVQHASRLRYD